jgi:hypothetical protein
MLFKSYLDSYTNLSASTKDSEISTTGAKVQKRHVTMDESIDRLKFTPRECCYYIVAQMLGMIYPLN